MYHVSSFQGRCCVSEWQESSFAIGSTDDVIKVWVLHRKKEIGWLMPRKCIQCSTYLLNTNGRYEDHNLKAAPFPLARVSSLRQKTTDCFCPIIHTCNWVVLRTLKGHKGHANSAAVHPSNKVVLSVGEDNTLRLSQFVRSASNKVGYLQELDLFLYGVEGEVIRIVTRRTVSQ